LKFIAKFINIILDIFNIKPIKTANFNILKKNEVPGAISIALLPSNFVDVKFEYKALAPNYKLINSLKKKKISEEKFISLYNEQLSELNPNNVLEHLESITGIDEPVMMCHCAKTKFCHRHLAADWLEKNLKIKIEEFNKSDFERRKGYLVKRKDPSLFNSED
tara:strand:+ start:141 stop:629 length:489 start_codon:yes stop_codon:yes gene_type:complete